MSLVTFAEGFSSVAGGVGGPTTKLLGGVIFEGLSPSGDMKRKL